MVEQTEMGETGQIGANRGVSTTFRGYSFLKHEHVLDTNGNILDTRYSKAYNKDSFLPYDLRKQMSSQYNVPDDCILITGGNQRSRTISLANQSIVTEGIDPKKIYAMNFQGFRQLFSDIEIKANEYEFNSYNNMYLKRWKMANEIAWENHTSVPLNKDKNSPYHQHLKGGPALGKDVSHWDYINQSIMQAPHMEECKITEQDLENDADLYRKTDKSNVDHKVTQVLVMDKNIDKYTKNLIMYNDVINNVKSERKRAQKQGGATKRPIV